MEGPSLISSLAGRQWADDDMQFEEIYTENEVNEILLRAGLPHCRAERPEPVQPPPAFPEAEEPLDELVEHGLAIGRAGHGRGGLHMRPHQRDANAAVEGRWRLEPRAAAPAEESSLRC